MKRPILALLFACALRPASARGDVWQPSAGHRQIPIWPAGPPGRAVNCRPDFAVALYPGHHFDYGKTALHDDLPLPP